MVGSVDGVGGFNLSLTRGWLARRSLKTMTGQHCEFRISDSLRHMHVDEALVSSIKNNRNEGSPDERRMHDWPVQAIVLIFRCNSYRLLTRPSM